MILLARAFANQKIPADVFARSYVDLWDVERDLALLPEDDEARDLCLYRIHCAAHDYCDGDAEGTEHAPDATQLHAAVVAAINEWMMQQIHATRG